MKCKVHKYKRIKSKTNKYDVYSCIRCPHYVTEPFVIGRECECWYCGNNFLMSPKSLLLKPHCGCRNTISLEKVSKGAIIESQDIVSQVRIGAVTKAISEDKSLKHDVIDTLLDKFAKQG